MPLTDKAALLHLAHALGKATGLGVRVAEQGRVTDYVSPFHLHPDPAGPELPALLNQPHRAGVSCTPLLQLYGTLTLEQGRRLILGPTRPHNTDPRLMEEQLFLLRVPEEQRADYLRTLQCCPDCSAERMVWLMVALGTLLTGAPFPAEAVFVDMQPEDGSAAVQHRCLFAREQRGKEPVPAGSDPNYAYEKLICSLIRQGETERLRDVLKVSTATAGKMSDDSLRQVKNTGICTAAVASRAAIEGGMDSRTAFLLSDLYIQRIELLRDIPAVLKLREEIMVDYAERVRRLRYRVGDAGDVFSACAKYVDENLYAPLRVEDVAAALGYSRSYLSTRFRQQTGMTLTRYILQEKVFEAQRLLQFSEESLRDIANTFGFSSQSHFQNVFKSVTGETPMAFRRRVGKSKHN